MQQKRIGVFRAYGAFWKYYADFSSRTSKEAFWKAFFLHSLLYLIMTSPMYYVYESIIERNDIIAGLWLLPLAVYSVATVIPTIAIILRRLHDIDRNGCWFFLYLIPVAGTIVFFIMLSKPSAPFDVYPGRSGAGPYMQPQNAPPQYAPPQYAPPQYIPPQYAQPQNPYAQPQNPYAQPQNPYAPPPYVPIPNPYAPPQYYRPLPPPRRFAPPAGGNKALLAIILSIIVAVCSNAYSIVYSVYIQDNIDRYINTLIGDMFVDDFGGFYDPYDPYGGQWDESDPWGNDFWGGFPDFGQNEEGQLTEDELSAIDLVRRSTLDGFPDFTIEEVLLTRVEAGSLEWGCLSEEEDGYPFFYVYASGLAIGDFVLVYAGFDVYHDGTIEIYNLDDGDRDEYHENAREMYREWYDAMLLAVDTPVA